MNSYYLTLVLKPDLEEKARAELLDTLKKKFERVVKEDLWGVKDLAYPIKKQVKALYVYFELEATAPEMLEFEKRLRIDERVLRYLLIASEVKVSKVEKEEKKRPARSKKA